MTHTPGPWNWRDGHEGLVAADGYQVLRYEPYEGMWVPYYDNGVADGRLIAAAPDLLEALKLARSYIQDDVGLSIKLPEVEAAIAKAEGK